MTDSRPFLPHTVQLLLALVYECAKWLQDLWGGDSQLQTQGTWDPTVDLANNVAEVALQESVFPDPGNETLSAVPFQDVDGHAAREPAFQETGAADSSDDEGTPKDLPAWTCAYDLHAASCFALQHDFCAVF